MKTAMKTVAIVLLIIAAGVLAQTTLVDGKDGTGTRRTIAVDANRNQVVVGSGAAGTPAGGILTVQGASGGTAVTVSGSVAPAPSAVATASNTGTCTSVTTTATLIAANGSRHSVLFQASTANTKNVRWSKAASATNVQMILAPGQAMLFDGAGGHIYTGAYSFVSEDGSAQTVCVQEE